MGILSTFCSRFSLVSVVACAALAPAQEYATWSNACKVVINTSSSGAGISEDLTGFPILVRLDGTVFDVLSSAEPNGADIRFADADGNPIPYEIESWESSSAAIWVRVPTLQGSDAAQYILMYWGKDGATSESDPGAVFDTANGFQGVWHFAEAAGATALDATYNGFDGTPVSSPADAEGVIGQAKTYNGSSSGFVMEGTATGKLNFQARTDSYCVSAWANLTEWDFGQYKNVCNKSDRQYNLLCTENGKWEFCEFSEQAQYDMTGYSFDMATKNEWNYLVGGRTGATSQFLYVNAVKDESITSKGEEFAHTYEHPFGVGRLTNSDGESGDNFSGRIDEVRVESVVRSDDWVKMCYEAQKSGSSILSFEAATPVIDAGRYAGSELLNRMSIRQNTQGLSISVPGAMPTDLITVCNAQGRVLKAVASGAGQYLVPAQMLVPGMYVVRVNGTAGQKTKQFMYTR